MATTNNPRPPRRTFGPADISSLNAANNDIDSPRAANPSGTPFSHSATSATTHGRPSFWSRTIRILSRRKRGEDEETLTPERPPIPSALQSSGEVHATPLPILPMIVLSITMLGEFLSANVSMPFLLFMVKGFGELHDEADIAFWTGIIVSTFFLTQFLTSLLWATVAEKHGRRSVLIISLFGSAVTCLLFGTTTSIRQAIVIRLMQGIFAGAVGVARGSMAFITDPSNEGRAYAILGFCWGLGGVVGAIIGGSFERPADKWPGTFERHSLFVNYPYLLPCGVAACITMIGSLLACFLNRDGGPREGAIRLPPEKDNSPPNPITEEQEESRPPTPIFNEHPPVGFIGSLKRKLPFFSSSASNIQLPDDDSPSQDPPVPLSSQSPRSRAFGGSAYGYSAATRARLARATSALQGGRGIGSLTRRRGSHNSTPRETHDASDMNFAQRILMANEHAVTSIADLWVAAAMNVDNEDVVEGDADSDSEELEERSPANASLGLSPSRGHLLRSETGGQNQSPSPSRPTFTQHRHPSTASIFSHAGVKTPTAVLDAQQHQMMLSRTSDEGTHSGRGLATISEHRSAQNASEDDLEAGTLEKQPSLWSQIPTIIILQYGFLALHSTTHDQVFMSYLVSDYEAGGLNLNAGHFAQLIALMCLAQIAYQFYLYPNIGPPRGRFSHLSMFRIGSVLFIPAYLSVILYRPLAGAHDDGNFLLMAALAVSTAVRYSAITFAYTSVSILLNYMTPPNAIGIANGIAQSIVSLARCFGPILGGYLWSVSIEKDPSGYPFGFLACGGFCLLAILHSYFIR